MVEKLRRRLEHHRPLARPEEPPERIPGSPPATYGEEENARYGDWVRKRSIELGLKEQDAKANRKRRR